MKLIYSKDEQIIIKAAYDQASSMTEGHGPQMRLIIEEVALDLCHEEGIEIDRPTLRKVAKAA